MTINPLQPHRGRSRQASTLLLVLLGVVLCSTALVALHQAGKGPRDSLAAFFAATGTGRYPQLRPHGHGHARPAEELESSAGQCVCPSAPAIASGGAAPASGEAEGYAPIFPGVQPPSPAGISTTVPSAAISLSQSVPAFAPTSTPSLRLSIPANLHAPLPPSPWLLGLASLSAAHEPTPTPAQARIMIMQHFNLHDARVHNLQNHSMAQHERYAGFWGYGYHVSYDEYVYGERTVRQRQTNKLYALLRLALGELAKGDEGAEWIMISDADTLIRNPLVPLHAMVPPSDRFHHVFILGSEDFNGFNSGNLVYRCGPDLIAFLAHALGISDSVTRNYEAIVAATGEHPPDGGPIETPPSDQRALCLALEAQPAYASRFYHYPQVWLNAYPGWEMPQDGIMLNVHMVNTDKYRENLDEFTWHEQWAMTRMREMGFEELRLEVERIGKHTSDFWSHEARVGLPHCVWI